MMQRWCRLTGTIVAESPSEAKGQCQPVAPPLFPPVFYNRSAGLRTPNPRLFSKLRVIAHGVSAGGYLSAMAGRIERQGGATECARSLVAGRWRRRRSVLSDYSAAVRAQ